MAGVSVCCFALPSWAGRERTSAQPARPIEGTPFREPGAPFLIHLAYIVGLGKPVVGRKAWVEARGRAANIPRDAVIHHEAASCKVKAAFALQPATDRQLADALRFISGAMPESKWRVFAHGVNFKAEPFEKVVRVDGSFSQWLSSARKVTNTRGARAWTGEGQRLA